MSEQIGYDHSYDQQNSENQDAAPTPEKPKDTIYTFKEFIGLVEDHMEKCEECINKAGTRHGDEWMNGSNKWAESALHILTIFKIASLSKKNSAIRVLIPENEMISNQWALAFLHESSPSKHNILVPYTLPETADGSLIKDMEPFEASDTYIDPSLS